MRNPGCRRACAASRVTRSGALMAVEPCCESRQSPRPTGATGSPPTWALAGIDCELRRGEVMVVVGPSGSGKSTLLRTLNGLRPSTAAPSRWTASLTDPATDINRWRTDVGMVFQHSTCSSIATRSTTGAARSAWCAAATAPRPSATPASCWAASAWPSTAPAIPASCPAASSSAWRSRARWPWIPSSCCSTRPRRRSIPRPWAASWS